MKKPRAEFMPGQVQFLVENCASGRVVEITRSFNAAFGTAMTPGQIRAFAVRHGLEFKERLRYTPEQVRFLQEHYAGQSVPELARSFNLAFGTSLANTQIKNFVANHNAASGLSGNVRAATEFAPKQVQFLAEACERCTLPETTRAFNEAFGTEMTQGQIRFFADRSHLKFKVKKLCFTPEQVQFVSDSYLGRRITELTSLFNETFGTEIPREKMKSFVNSHKISSGLPCQFQPGHSPWHAGIKGVMPPPTAGFKKGNVPPKRKPIGSERIVDNCTVQVKVTKADIPNRVSGWKPKHELIYEQAHGPIPPGMVVLFSDSNRRNFEPSNLQLVSRSELFRLNLRGYIKTPDEIKPSILALAKLEALIAERRKTVEEWGTKGIEHGLPNDQETAD